MLECVIVIIVVAAVIVVEMRVVVCRELCARHVFSKSPSR